MTPERWQRMESLYDAVSEMDADERARFLAVQCADDEDLRCELMRLFRDGDSGLTGVVEQAAADIAPDQWSGHRLGPYRIQRRLGQGGMGSVYLAVRDDDQFRKQVAIKTLKFEAVESFTLQRFRHERQILANLEHANIARLLDGGTTDQGTPYIVLEYVAGTSITSYCNERRLTIENRLHLFRQVCAAVQYAHQNLIVHRDIKPGNVLVTADGVPKLLDFGIAKLLDPGASTGEVQPATATGLHPMTPDYASPEQVRGQAVSTATDIYSLGVVLYELLTGKRPHELQNYDALEIAHVICETEIQPPSAHGNRRLRGDLDNIVLKALQRDPGRRYSSVEQFSEDIRRHLDGLPIAARPDTATYRAAKFVRRHWLGVISAAAVVAALAVGLGVSMYEARIAQRRFAQVRELANTFLFQFYDQVTPLAGSTAVRASIVDTARKYLDGLSQEAGNDKGLILELAQAYERLGDVQGRWGSANLGQGEEARRSFKRALDLYSRLGVTEASSSELRHKVARVLYLSGRIEFNTYHEDVAEKFTRQALDLVGRPTSDAEILRFRAQVEASLGQIRLKQGHPAEGVAFLESARHTLVDLQSADNRDPTLRSVFKDVQERLARAKVDTGDLDGALNDFLELIRNSPRCDEQNPPGDACRYLGDWLMDAADVYAALDKPNLNEPGKAAILYEQALHIQERFASLDANDRQARFDLAARCGKLGDAVWKADPHRALALYDRALATARSLASKEQLEILRDSYLAAIGRPLIQLGRIAEARKAMTEELERAKTDEHSLYPDRLGEVMVRAVLPDLLIAEDKKAEARKALADLIRDTEAMRAGHAEDLTPVYYLSQQYRALASMTTGQKRRDALLHSAAAWHSWPPTSYTIREEQKDLAAANR